MNTRFLTVLITLAFLGISVTAVAKGKPLKPGGSDSIYTAELTADFVFISGDLTAGRKGKSLLGNGKLEVLYSGNAQTDNIFRKYCSALLTADGIEAFEVLENNWGISRTKSRGAPDQIHITMNNLMIDTTAVSEAYSQVDFDLHLHGEIAEGEDFLPESGSISHTLTKYMLWGGGQGANGWLVCNSTGGGMDTWELLPQGLTLTITRK